MIGTDCPGLTTCCPGNALMLTVFTAFEAVPRRILSYSVQLFAGAARKMIGADTPLQKKFCASHCGSSTACSVGRIGLSVIIFVSRSSLQALPSAGDVKLLV